MCDCKADDARGWREASVAGCSLQLDEATALRLCALTSEFYRANAESFSQTRQAPWQGWARVLDVAGVMDALAPAVFAPSEAHYEGLHAADGLSLASRQPLEAPSASLAVLDLACGNLRFERYLASQLPHVLLSCYAVDNCDSLVGEARNIGGLPSVSFQELNIIEALAAGNLASTLEAPDAACNLAVAFGFMHHVPIERWRVALLRSLAAKVRSGGVVVVSFWRFLNSEKLAKKAAVTTKEAQDALGLPQLPPNDFLLGWQDTQGLYRYCHHFDESEIERLTCAVADIAQPIARFAADGKTGNLNEYLVLRVK